MMHFCSKTRKIKYFLDPPPPKKRLRDMNGCDMATHSSVCLYKQTVTWIFTRSRLSDSDYKVIPSLKNCYLIIVVFHPHISAFMIFFIQKKTHEVSTKWPLTLNSSSSMKFIIEKCLLFDPFGIYAKVIFHF